MTATSIRLHTSFQGAWASSAALFGGCLLLCAPGASPRAGRGGGQSGGGEGNLCFAGVRFLGWALLITREFCLLPPPPLFFFFLFPFLSCSLSHSGTRSLATTGWLSSTLAVIAGSSRHLRAEIDLGHPGSRGVIAVVTAPVSKATTAFW